MILGNNVTSIKVQGFPIFQNFTFLIFSLLVLIYCGTISGNFLIMVLYLVSKSLRSPMYFFITHLSLCDLIVATDIVPTLLLTALYGDSTMTLIGCIIQFCIFSTTEFSECFLLSVMSYDRYVAICNPLRYHSIMSHMFCVKSVTIIWLIFFFIISVNLTSMYNFHLCGRHIIDHFYCDREPLIQLTCSDTAVIHTSNLIAGSIVVVLSLIVIVMSYVYIVITILKIPSSTGRHKAFSTCSSHLTVVSIFCGAIMAVYMFPTKGESLILNRVLSLMYTVVTPLLNPIIYTLRNKDFQEAFHKLTSFILFL